MYINMFSDIDDCKSHKKCICHATKSEKQQYIHEWVILHHNSLLLSVHLWPKGKYELQIEFTSFALVMHKPAHCFSVQTKPHFFLSFFFLSLHRTFCIAWFIAHQAYIPRWSVWCVVDFNGNLWFSTESMRSNFLYQTAMAITTTTKSPPQVYNEKQRIKATNKTICKFKSKQKLGRYRHKFIRERKNVRERGERKK